MPDPVVADQGTTLTPGARTDAPVATEAVPELPDFDTALAALTQHLVKGTPEYDERLAKLRAHPTVAGVAGNIAETMKRTQEAQASIEAAAKAARDKEQELLDLAENDPEEFAARFRTQAQAERARKELEALRSTEEQRIAGHIGLAVRDLPELQELTLAEQRKIADALAGVPADAVLGTYTKVVIDIAADKRAVAKAEADYPARLAAEMEAAQIAANANRLRSTSAPSLVGGGGGQPTDAPDPVRDPVGYVRWIDSGGRRR